MKSPWTRLRALVFLPLLALALGAEGRERTLDPEMHHLGDTPTPEWPEADPEPRPGPYVLRFEARFHASEHVLVLAQRNVDDTWWVRVNGREVATLERHDQLRDVLYTLPPGTLVDGENELRIVPSTTTDDITVGRVRLVEATLREHLGLSSVLVRVVDRDAGTPLPARLTFTDGAGNLEHLFFAESPHTAVREGVLYVGEREAHLELSRGEHVVYATRGPEWSLDRQVFTVGDGITRLELGLRREVDTTGFVAVDTHIHTLTFSGHGDASLEERMVTLAGEGVELAVATDHNHQIDYGEARRASGLGRWFTPVTGNEVTTGNGHFNAFPLGADGPLVDHTLPDWVDLVADMRAKGALAVILNHPRWPTADTGPHGVFGLESATGRRASGPAFTFDAMEVINSQTVEPDPMLLFRDWFGLLDRGERIMAAGSSDSHTVGGPVGGGRTYVRSATDDPSALDVEALARDLAAGHSSVSMGILAWADARVAPEDGGDLGSSGPVAGMGELLTAPDRPVLLRLRVAAPGWVRPHTARVVLDGEVVAERALEPRPGEPLDETLEVTVPPGRTDAWIVAVVEGDGVDGPYWPIVNDYTLAATNPVLLDRDGDGVYTPPRETARALFAADVEADRVLAPPADADRAVTLQYLDLLEAELRKRAGERLRAAGAEAAARWPEVGDLLERRTEALPER